MNVQTIYVESDDNTYVDGNMYSLNNEHNQTQEPYYYFGKPEYDDDDSKQYLTVYFPSISKFKVYTYSFKETTISYINNVFENYNISEEGIIELIWKNITDSHKIFLNFNLFDYRLLRVIYTSTSWSEDYEKYDIQNGQITKITITEHGFNSCYINCDNNIIKSIDYIGKKIGIGEYFIGGPVPHISQI